MSEANIGCSGFSYDDWKGTFYPEEVSKKQWLQYYSEIFSTVELNVTFYRQPKAETFEKWRKQTPEDFRFALKGSRFITHIKRLREPDEPTARFMEGARILGDKLGLVLWQFPPSFRKDTDRLRSFLKILSPYRQRNAFEFRNDSWLDDRVFRLLRQAGCSLCMADWPPFLDNLPLTTDFIYIRRHGHGGDYSTKYSENELRSDARRIKQYLKDGRDVNIYFNNDAKGYAPRNALELKGILKA